MAKVEFKKDGISVDVPAGTALMNICDEHGASVAFSCRVGACTSCLVTVLSGLENLSPMTEQEKITLEGFGAKPNQRLACQVVVNGDCVIE